MTCVTAADLGKPIAAIVQRCGAPVSVASTGGQNTLYYLDHGHDVTVWFDADQTRARVIGFEAMPSRPDRPVADWPLTLPFESGQREVTLTQTTLADAQSALAEDADVTTSHGAAFRSSDRNDTVLDCNARDQVVTAAFIGERASLVQIGLIAPELSSPPLDFTSAIARGAMLQGPASGPRTTIFRVDTDAGGIVRKVTVIIPSGDPAFDTAEQARIGDVRFAPETLDNHSVPGTSFVQIRH